MALPTYDLVNVTSYITYSLLFYKNIVSCTNKYVIDKNNNDQVT